MGGVANWGPPAWIYSIVLLHLTPGFCVYCKCFWQESHMEVFISFLSAGRWQLSSTQPLSHLCILWQQWNSFASFLIARLWERYLASISDVACGYKSEKVGVQYKRLAYFELNLCLCVSVLSLSFAFKYTGGALSYQPNRPWNAVSLMQLFF